MFFKKMFNKDCRFFLERGEKYLADARYADARHAFQEGLQRLHGEPAGIDGLETRLKSLLAEAGNQLGRMNLLEAEHALAQRDYQKALEHIDLAVELAADPAIGEAAEKLKEKMVHETPEDSATAATAGCSGCTSDAAAPSEVDHVPEYLSPRERYELLIQTVPVGLRERYDAQGEEFWSGYLLAHGGEEGKGAAVFRRLLENGDDDILLYELALTRFKVADLAECEDLLTRALAVNSENSLCCMGLVQLLTETGRLHESLPVLQHMIEKRLLVEQALLFLGDVHRALGDEDKAVDCYSQAMSLPNAAKSAAERLIPILESRGRRDDAAHLAKRYLKGCC